MGEIVKRNLSNYVYIYRIVINRKVVIVHILVFTIMFDCVQVLDKLCYSDARVRGSGCGLMTSLSLRSSENSGGATSIFSAVHFALENCYHLTRAKCPLRKSGRSPAFPTVPSGSNRLPRSLASQTRSIRNQTSVL